jgi:hypothetical protein
MSAWKPARNYTNSHDIARINPICKAKAAQTRRNPQMPASLMILIAGPYRSGTGDDPAKMAANLAALEQAAWPIFQKGHVPMIGEWAALPILRGAGGGAPGSAPYDAVMHPTAQRLLQKCDGVLRLPGASTGADNDVRIAKARGIPVWTAISQIPDAG